MAPAFLGGTSLSAAKGVASWPHAHYFVPGVPPSSGGGAILARVFRVYQKKRGHRLTGSRTVGSAGEAVLSAAFIVMGCVGFTLLLKLLVIPEWRVNHEFVPQRCTVRDTYVGASKNSGGTLYRPEIEISYRVDDTTYTVRTYDIHFGTGKEYSSSLDDVQAILARYVKGREYPCWYAPTDPKAVVLVRGYSWWIWLTFIVPLSFVIIGGRGLAFRLLHLGTSAERRSALTRQAGRLDLFDNGNGAHRKYPSIPDCSGITDSPGTVLAYRLPIHSSPAWFLFWLGASCALWNAVVWVFAAIAITDYQEGHPDWKLTISMVPFVLAGIGLIAYWIRQILLANGIGPTLAEVSHHPLMPGERYDLFISQAGRLRLKSLAVLLVSEEQATYRQGTNTRSETRRVYQRELFRRDNFEIPRGTPLEVRCPLEIPARAMHSFKAEHNEVGWKIVVEGTSLGWPHYERAFPLIVHPCNGDAPA